MLIHVINGEQSLARIDHVTFTCALVVGQSPSVRSIFVQSIFLSMCCVAVTNSAKTEQFKVTGGS